jgi:hypothetical protein
MPEDEQFYFDPSLPISESFASVPAEFKAFLRAAFSSLAKVVAAGKISELVEQLSSDGTDGRTISRATSVTFAAQAGIDLEQALRLFSAATFSAAALVSQRALTPEEFVSAGVQVGFIAETDSRNVLLLAQGIVANRTPIAEITKQNRLVHALLPSLASFRTVIDLRPSFTDDGNSIAFSVPVIVGHIVNDSTEDVWIQMSKKQVERLISDLQDVLRRVDVLEQWAGKQPYKEIAK